MPSLMQNFIVNGFQTIYIHICHMLKSHLLTRSFPLTILLLAKGNAQQLWYMGTRWFFSWHAVVEFVPQLLKLVFPQLDMTNLFISVLSMVPMPAAGYRKVMEGPDTLGLVSTSTNPMDMHRGSTALLFRTTISTNSTSSSTTICII